MIAYKRVLLKLSGEALSGGTGFGIDHDTVDDVCAKIKEIIDLGVQVSIVCGGGNFWRGAKNGHKMDRVQADYMGMLATVMNGLCLQDALDQIGIGSSLETPIEMTEIAEPFVKRKALKHLNKGRVVIFACGTGHPYFSTDTCAALRAVETESDIILCGKTIDAVYSADPKTDPNAVRYEHISFQDVLEKNLKVMDATAIALCRDNNMPIRVFAMADTENIVRLIKGEQLGTLVDGQEG